MAPKLFYKLYQTLIAILIFAMLTGCAAPQPPATATAVGCRPSQVQASESGFAEIQGEMHADGELWALLFFDKAHAAEELKIVWKMTGSGEKFTVEAKHEDGTVISPIWGPEQHSGSNWHRPGPEWGTGFNFPKPGCWTLTASYGTTIGEIRLDILPAAGS